MLWQLRAIVETRDTYSSTPFKSSDIQSPAKIYERAYIVNGDTNCTRLATSPKC